MAEGLVIVGLAEALVEGKYLPSSSERLIWLGHAQFLARCGDENFDYCLPDDLADRFLAIAKAGLIESGIKRCKPEAKGKATRI